MTHTHSVGFPWWKEIGPVAEAAQHTTLTTDIMSPAGFEPVIPPSDRLQTHALNRAATGTGGFDSENLKAQVDIFAILLLKSTNPI